MKIVIVFFIFALFHSSTKAGDCSPAWKSSSNNSHCEMINYQTQVKYPVTSIFGHSPDEAFITSKIRAGYLKENTSVSFKGNILYLQGLADSMLNHAPLFNQLTAQGFRVIAFDYMGQGGSNGSMNDTRLEDIPVLAKNIYLKFARDYKIYKKPIVLGWSTGGLAAYLMAINNEASKVIMISPGIAPKVILGEHNFWELDFDIITLKTLTSKSYGQDEINPHVDPIRPRSPLAVKDFAADLILTSLSARIKKASPQVSGLVLLSGKKDTYVKSQLNAERLKVIAPHFRQINYPNALHEIDNEISSIQEAAQKDIIHFLLKK